MPSARQACFTRGNAMGRAQESKACEECGAAFLRLPCHGGPYWSRKRFCSRGCFGKSHARKSAKLRPSLRDKFNEKVVISADGCWHWSGLKDKDGYGLLNYARKVLRAPVVALELDGRPVPKGKYACHRCDNPGCIRPDHLYVGTPAENMRDAVERRRLRPRSKLTANQVIEIRSAGGTDEATALRYGVARATVSLIRERKTWRHLP